MREEADFGDIYKKIIDGHFAPERERSEAALRTILGRLFDQEKTENPQNHAGPSRDPVV